MPEGETFIQREIVPIDAIKDAYVILPERRNIKIKFEVDGHIYSRIEYYKNEIDCIKRWSMIRHYLGGRAKLDTLNPVPLPMDAEEMDKRVAEAEAAKYEAKAKALRAKIEKGGMTY